MKESLLWDHMRPELAKVGKFQKVSDRFTPGIPDVLGCYKGRGMAFELKEFKGVHLVKLKFHPGQLDWLIDWKSSGGASWIISTHGSIVTVHPPEYGQELELGLEWAKAVKLSSLTFQKNRTNRWLDFINSLVVRGS